ncbi:hypothetical protein C8R44DRAFT_743116 [Mycena epipterygia]|nr:hypothetical protein C8R44DRAFT_743116 [Mycena epipterygia]
MLKKDDERQQLVYYQAGIGIYTIPEIANPSLAKLHQAVDAMPGSHLNAHVMSHLNPIVLVPDSPFSPDRSCSVRNDSSPRLSFTRLNTKIRYFRQALAVDEHREDLQLGVQAGEMSKSHPNSKKKSLNDLEKQYSADVGGGTLPNLGELTFWLAKVACARAEWLVSGGGVDLGGITRPRPADRLASHSANLIPAK